MARREGREDSRERREGGKKKRRERGRSREGGKVG